MKTTYTKTNKHTNATAEPKLEQTRLINTSSGIAIIMGNKKMNDSTELHYQRVLGEYLFKECPSLGPFLRDQRYQQIAGAEYELIEEYVARSILPSSAGETESPMVGLNERNSEAAWETTHQAERGQREGIWDHHQSPIRRCYT